MTGTEAPPTRGAPRRFIACSAAPRPLCSSPTYVCVPAEPGFFPCALKPGKQQCGDAYPIETTVLDETGATVTLCCEKGTELT
jgi:hypothetical protein